MIETDTWFKNITRIRLLNWKLLKLVPLCGRDLSFVTSAQDTPAFIHHSLYQYSFTEPNTTYERNVFNFISFIGFHYNTI